MHASERLKLFQTGNPIDWQSGHGGFLSGTQHSRRLDDHIPRRRETLGRKLPQTAQRIAGKIPAMRALLDNRPLRRRAEALPHFHELPREQPSEERADAHVRDEIAAPSDRRAAG